MAEEISGSYCETALVSHENICNLPHAELLEFVACLSGCTFKVVLYLRRQDHYAASLYNQHVKAGVAFPGSFDEHFHRYRGRYDYQEMLERLGTVFGATNIVVRPYEKEQFFGGSIFADFMHHGFEWESLGELRIPERDQNSRLDRDALEFKRLINGLDAPKEQKLEIGRHLVKYCASVDPRNGEAFQVHALLSPQQRIKLLQTFVDSNTWVARTYLHRSDGKLFLEPWPGANDPWTPYSGLTTAKAAELTYHIYRSIERDAREREAKLAKGSRWMGITQLKSWPGQRWSLGVGRAIKWLGRHQLRQGRGLASRLKRWPKAPSEVG